MRYVERALTQNLKQMAGQFPAVFLTGPRQSGKSTLLRHCFDGYDYVNLEEGDSRAFAKDDPRGFLRGLTGNTILDEVQRVPELFSYLQTDIDLDDRPGRFLLSGSQNFLMMKSVSQSLAGRAAVLSLLPFDINELRPAGLLASSVDDWLLRGSYPRALVAKILPDDFYPSYIATYIERDIRNQTTIRDLARFQSFIRACAAKVGSLINLSDLGRDVGVDARTVSNWLSILEESYIAFRLTAYYRSVGNRNVRTAKLYFYDTGLLCSLLGIYDSSTLANSNLRGNIFENAVVVELHKQIIHRGRKPSAFFWRNQGNREKEVDLVLEQGQGLDLFEIKASQTANLRYLDNIRLFAAQSKLPCTANVIYCGQDSPGPHGSRFINWQSLAV